MANQIRLTTEQVDAIYDQTGDVDFILIEEGNGGNVDVLFDGLPDEKITIAANGDLI